MCLTILWRKKRNETFPNILYFTGKTFWKNQVGLLFIVSQCRGSFWYWKRNLSMAAKGIWVFPRDRMQKGPQLWQNHPSIDLEARKGIINRRLGIDLEPVISTFWFALPAGETVTSVISESCAYPKNLKSSFWEKWQLRRCQIINQWISNDLEPVISKNTLVWSCTTSWGEPGPRRAVMK